MSEYEISNYTDTPVINPSSLYNKYGLESDEVLFPPKLEEYFKIKDSKYGNGYKSHKSRMIDSFLRYENYIYHSYGIYTMVHCTINLKNDSIRYINNEIGLLNIDDKTDFKMIGDYIEALNNNRRNNFWMVENCLGYCWSIEKGDSKSRPVPVIENTTWSVEEYRRNKEIKIDERLRLHIFFFLNNQKDQLHRLGVNMRKKLFKEKKDILRNILLNWGNGKFNVYISHCNRGDKEKDNGVVSTCDSIYKRNLYREWITYLCKEGRNTRWYRKMNKGVRLYGKCYGNRADRAINLLINELGIYANDKDDPNYQV